MCDGRDLHLDWDAPVCDCDRSLLWQLVDASLGVQSSLDAGPDFLDHVLRHRRALEHLQLLEDRLRDALDQVERHREAEHAHAELGSHRQAGQRLADLAPIRLLACCGPPPFPSPPLSLCSLSPLLENLAALLP